MSYSYAEQCQWYVVSLHFSGFKRKTAKCACVPGMQLNGTAWNSNWNCRTEVPFGMPKRAPKEREGFGSCSNQARSPRSRDRIAAIGLIQTLKLPYCIYYWGYCCVYIEKICLLQIIFRLDFSNRDFRSKIEMFNLHSWAEFLSVKRHWYPISVSLLSPCLSVWFVTKTTKTNC